jgi:hypothetical protein
MCAWKKELSAMIVSKDHDPGKKESDGNRFEEADNSNVVRLRSGGERHSALQTGQKWEEYLT